MELRGLEKNKDVAAAIDVSPTIITNILLYSHNTFENEIVEKLIIFCPEITRADFTTIDKFDLERIGRLTPEQLHIKANMPVVRTRPTTVEEYCA